MPNATYSRFRNTARDLKDCLDHIHDPLIAGNATGEHAAREQLVQLCAKILEECGVSINPADIEIVEHGATEEDLPKVRPPGQS